MAKDKAPVSFEDIPLSTELPTAPTNQGASDFQDIPLSTELIPESQPTSVEDTAGAVLDPNAKKAEKQQALQNQQADIKAQFDANPGTDAGVSKTLGEKIQSNVADIPGSIVYGVGRFATESLKSAYQLAVEPMIQSLFGDPTNDADPSGPHAGSANAFADLLVNAGNVVAGAPSDALDASPIAPKTGTGQLVSGVATFVTGFLGWGKALKAMELLQGTGRMAEWASLSARGAAVDATAFDPHGGRLSDLVNQLAEDHTALANPITDYLGSKPGDSDADGRFKNALEGFFAGNLLNGVTAAFRGAKSVMAATKGIPAGTPEFTKAAIKAVDEMHTELQQIKTSAATESNISTEKAKVTGDQATDVLAASASTEFMPKFVKDEIVARLKNGIEGDNNHTIGRDFNFDKLNGPDDVKQAINLVSDGLAPEIDKLKGGIQTLKETTELADILGQDPIDLMTNISRDAKGASEQAARVVAGKRMLQSLAQQISKEANVVDNGVRGNERLNKLLATMGELQLNLKTVQTGAARTTSAGRIAVDVGDSAMLKALVMADGDPKAVLGLMKPLSGRLLDAFNELRINSLLSGPQTHVKNMTSNVLNTLLRSTEKMVGGVISGNGVGAKEGLSEFIGMTKAMGESWSYMKKAFLAEESILDPHSSKLTGPRKAISSAALGLNPDSVMGRFIDGAGKVIRFSTRTLTAEDEFFKQMNYRANLYARATQEGIDRGLGKDPKALSAYIHDRFQQSFTEAGAATDSQSLRHAQISTFTEPLRPGSILADVQAMSNKHPGFKVIVPFIKTPANLLKQNFQRTPGIQMMMKSLSEDIAAGGGRAAEARGKLATGAALYGTAAYLALSGKLVGRGPQNPDERKIWLTTHTPYTAVIGDKVVPLDSLDPHTIPLAMAADFVEAQKYMSGPDGENVSTAMIAAVAGNLTNKTYLKGLADALDAIQQPDHKMAYWIQQQVASTVVPALANQVRKEVDPTMREAQSIMDAIYNRTPGLSDKLPPRRNYLGQPIGYADGGPLSPINPFVFSDKTPGPVMEELVRLQHGFSMPPEKINDGRIDLHQFKTKTGQDAYDRLLELRNVKITNRDTLAEALDKLISSDRYKRLPDGTNVYDSKKLQIIQQVTGKFSIINMKQLRHEIPELDQAIKLDETKAKMVQRKGPSGLDALAPLLGK